MTEPTTPTPPGPKRSRPPRKGRRTPAEQREVQFTKMRGVAAMRFPEAFPAENGAPRRPLALGIYAQVKAAVPWPARRLGWFLSEWVRRPRYLKGVAAEGARRVNLDGTDAGAVSEEHRDLARAALAKRRSPRGVVTGHRGDAPDPASAAGRQRDRADSEAPARSILVEGAAPAG